jgi:hypothetical protein
VRRRIVVGEDWQPRLHDAAGGAGWPDERSVCDLRAQQNARAPRCLRPSGAARRRAEVLVAVRLVDDSQMLPRGCSAPVAGGVGVTGIERAQPRKQHRTLRVPARQVDDRGGDDGPGGPGDRW